MRFSRDGTSIISVRQLKALTLTRQADFSESTLNDSDGSPRSFRRGELSDFSPCGTMVVVGYNDTKVRILRPGAGRVL